MSIINKYYRMQKIKEKLLQSGEKGKSFIALRLKYPAHHRKDDSVLKKVAFWGKAFMGLLGSILPRFL